MTEVHQDLTMKAFEDVLDGIHKCDQENNSWVVSVSNKYVIRIISKASWRQLSFPFNIEQI